MDRKCSYTIILSIKNYFLAQGRQAGGPWGVLGGGPW